MMMRARELWFLLVIELLSVAVAILSFRYIDERFWAAMVAGGTFCLVGVVAVVITWRWLEKYYSLTFWLAHVHLWMMAIPLVANRILKGDDFSDQMLFGLYPIATVHAWSEKIFIALIVATLIDLLRIHFKKWRRPQRGT